MIYLLNSYHASLFQVHVENTTFAVFDYCKPNLDKHFR